MATALEQFTTRAQRVLRENWPPFKYDNYANASLLANLFPLDSFLPSDGMFVAEAKIQIAKGAIVETAGWRDAFLEFHAVTQGAYSLVCNVNILEKALQGRKPTPGLLVQIASDHAGQLVVTAEASAQAARDQRHEQLWTKYAPKLLEGPVDGMNIYAVQMENKRRQAIADDMWTWSLERFEELDRKKKLMNTPVEELRKIVKDAEPARVQRIVNGDRHDAATPQVILDMRARAEEQVRLGIKRPIPAEFKIPGKDITVPWSKSLLAQLPPEIMRQLLNLYGNDALTAACETTKFRLLQKQQ